MGSIFGQVCMTSYIDRVSKKSYSIILPSISFRGKMTFVLKQIYYKLLSRAY